VAVKNETQSIVVNAAELEISKASITFGMYERYYNHKPLVSFVLIDCRIESTNDWVGDNKTLDASIQLDDKDETATFQFAESLPVGNAALTIVFTGVLNDKVCKQIQQPEPEQPEQQL
jgi:hypothetical protein